MLSSSVLTRLYATVRWVVLVVAGSLIMACSSGPEVVSKPAPEKVEQNEYRIGPGDTLQVFVWNQPELTVRVPVRPDGMISTPLIAGVPAAGKTAPELAKDLETAHCNHHVEHCHLSPIRQ